MASAHSRSAATREVVLKIAVRHGSRDALQIFAHEIYPAATSMAQSLTGFAGGRPEPQPVVRLFSFLIDKGDIANIGVIARHPDYLPILRRALTPEAVRAHFAHYVEGEVERFEWPGLGGFNFLLHRALGGGGIASLRHDPQGKAMAQVLMDFPVAVPAAWVQPGGRLASFADMDA